MTAERSDYVAYLLRLWRSETDGEAVWRASIESPTTGERRGFANIDQLFEFLREETRGSAVHSRDATRGADDIPEPPLRLGD